jgi:hypothetical protein
MAIWVNATTLEANAALRSIVRRDTGERYQEFLTRLAKESGIETPNREQLPKLDRKRPKGFNDDWKALDVAAHPKKNVVQQTRSSFPPEGLRVLRELDRRRRESRSLLFPAPPLRGGPCRPSHSGRWALKLRLRRALPSAQVRPVYLDFVKAKVK